MSDDGCSHIISFNRGDWEAAFLALAS